MNVAEIEKMVMYVKNGFKPMKDLAFSIYKNNSIDQIELLANDVYQSKYHQVRMVAVFLYGYIANTDPNILNLLKTKVSFDDNWRVQEILAMAFDQFCSDHNYEDSLPIIKEWLTSEHANVRRAVSEGLRIWTSRPYFANHPNVAIEYLSALHEDESLYVRKSIGNALRDISKRHPQLIIDEINSWNLEDSKTLQVYKLVIKNGLLKNLLK